MNAKNKTITQLWKEARELDSSKAPPDDASHFAAFIGGIIVAKMIANDCNKPMTEDFVDELQSLIEGQFAELHLK